MNDFLNQTSIFSMVDISRNIKNYPFPNALNKETKENLLELILSSLYVDEISEEWLKIIRFDLCTQKEKEGFLNKNYIDQDFLSAKEGKLLLIAQDNSVSIMLMGQDHIKVRAFANGNNITYAYSLANKIVNILENNLPIAFNEQLGFLTENPANLGTAMHGSVLLKIPYLELSGEIPKIMESVSRIGLNLRPYNSVSENTGLYILSNTITLGISEDDAINNLDAIATQIADYESMQLDKTVY